ncbi:MAG: Glu/Leu/Phe/Val dehydrogenase dimerization domain-containing protein [Planctomycetota bacterium]|jgi:leucine dehydrogenase
MQVFSELMQHDHEQVVFGYDAEAGLKAIIAIHNTALGPALGGTRMWPYATEGEALHDVLRLARGMTYKAALAGLNLGGGKAVIIGDPEKEKNEILFRAFGRLVDSLHGRYITAEDVGTSLVDMEWVRAETRYVTGVAESHGGSGDPSPVTARGVLFGMKACVEKVTGSRSLHGRRVALQGAGHVGLHLIGMLHEEGAELIVCDPHPERTEHARERYGAHVVPPDAIYDVEADVFAPCALGAIINDDTIPRLRCRIIAGAANNQLADEDIHGPELQARGILYAPDYAINSGGLINVENELQGYDRQWALAQAEGIYGVIKAILEVSEEESIPTHVASNRIAERRIERVGRLRRRFVTNPPVLFQTGRVFK